MAGEHRGLGPGITKVRSLKMDRKVWTEELIKVLAQTSPKKPFLGATPCSLYMAELLAVGWGVLNTAGLFQADSSPLGGHHGVAWLGRGSSTAFHCPCGPLAPSSAGR